MHKREIFFVKQCEFKLGHLLVKALEVKQEKVAHINHVTCLVFQVDDLGSLACFHTIVYWLVVTVQKQ